MSILSLEVSKSQKTNKNKTVDRRVSAKGPKRVRRSAEEARRVILDAAEERLNSYGPEGIRIKDIADDIGVSHPTILHHFESRDGLVEALTNRASRRLRHTLLTAFDPERVNIGTSEAIEQVLNELSDPKIAKLWAWLELGRREDTVYDPGRVVQEVAKLLHEKRVEEADKAANDNPDFEDTLFVVLLLTLTAFGNGVAGHVLAESAGLDTDGRNRFNNWLAQTCVRHLQACA